MRNFYKTKKGKKPVNLPQAILRDLSTEQYISQKVLKEIFNKYYSALNEEIGISKFSQFKKYLEDAKIVEVHRVGHRNVYIPQVNSIFKKVLYFHKNSFLSHFTALYLHQVTLENPRKIYVSYEEPIRRKKTYAILTQEAIDRAFAKPIKPSKNVIQIDGYEVQFILRKHTGLTGVIKREVDGYIISYSSLERVLIEAIIRPEYCGGILEVINVYRRIKDVRLSTQKFMRIYRALKLIYPYHQSIGFLLEKTGNRNEKLINELYAMPKTFDFYLVHDVRKEDLSYDPKWRLYYPKSLGLT